MLLMHNLSLNSFQKMESAICLRHCPFPYGSKGFQGARPSRFHHLKINHATPLSLPQISTTRSSVTRSFGHANCMLERFSSVPSENEGSGNKILRGVTLSSLVLTCVLGLFSFGGKNMNPKLTTAYGNGLEFPISKPQGLLSSHCWKYRKTKNSQILRIRCVPTLVCVDLASKKLKTLRFPSFANN